MSRKLARLAEIAIKGITSFSSSRQRRRVISRIIDKLSADSFSSVNCRKGQLRLNHLKSPHTANAVEHFFEDEPETLCWIDTFKEGETFYDVGAGIGIYSLYAALIPSVRVCSFEPNGLSFGLLVEHIRINEMAAKISPFCVALGKQTKKEDLLFNQFSEGAGGSSFGDSFYQRHAKEPTFSLPVLSFSLDGFLAIFELLPPNHIKIDVDGIEAQIIVGAADTLKGVDSIMLEVEQKTPEQIAIAIEQPLEKLGFKESAEFKGLGSGRNRLYRNLNSDGR